MLNCVAALQVVVIYGIVMDRNMRERERERERESGYLHTAWCVCVCTLSKWSTKYRAQNNGRTSDIFHAYCLIDRPQLYLGGHYVQTKFSSAGVACLEPTGYFLPHTQFKRGQGLSLH